MTPDLDTASQLTVYFQILVVHGCQYTINENTFLFIHILDHLSFVMVKGKNRERIKPQEYSQVLSSLNLEVGMKPKDRFRSVYQVTRPLL